MRLLLGTALAAVALQPALPAQRVRDLRLQDCFTLDAAVLPDHLEPLAWLDGARYLAFDAVEAADGPIPTFVAVDAVSGAVEVFLGAERLAGLAALPGMRADRVREDLAAAGAFHWSEDSRFCVVQVAGDLFVLRRDGAPRRLTASPGEKHGVQLSPDGRMVAFVEGDDLQVVAVDGGPVRALTEGGGEALLHGRLDWVYQEEVFGRGRWEGCWWSPDSTRIALLRLDQTPVQELAIPKDDDGRGLHQVLRYPTAGERNPVVGLGVVDVAGGEPRWFDLGQWQPDDPLIVRVNWHPSGEEVFFQVQDRAQTWMEMVAGDAADGALRTVFREDSSCWVEPGRDPVWLAGGAEFLWPSERDGYEHLYRYRRGGELIGRLTEGAYEVDRVLGVDEAAGQVWFLSDRGDWKQQNLFTVGLAGGEPRRITADDGWHEVELAPDNSKFVDSWSRAHVPASWSVRAADGELIRPIAVARTEVLQLCQVEAPKWVQVPTRDGFLMEGMLIEPRGFEPGRRYPVLQFTYAGPHAPRVLDRWRWRDFLWHQRMAQRGYLVFVVDNRSASGQGRVSACTAHRRLGQGELRDLEDAVDWLVAQGSADPARIAIWGWSYGGYQTLFNLTHSRRWAAGIAVNPVTDWRFYDSIYSERYMGLPQHNIAGYAAASVIEAAADLGGHLLLAHATMDENVHFRNSMFLVDALQEAGLRFRFLPYPRVRHAIADLEKQQHLFAEIEAFVDETIGGAR
jgi:dipeptidyl-peptidase-4